MHPSDGQPIENEQDDRADDGHDETHRIALAVQPHGPPQKPAEQRSGDAQQYGDDEPAGVAPGHQELRDDADDQTEDDPTDDSHLILPPETSPEMSRRTRSTPNGR